MPSRSGVSLKVTLDTLARVRPHQDDAVLTERNALDLDECPLKVVPSERSDSLRATTEGATLVIPELAS